MIQSLLDEIASFGYLFNNCYQLDDGSWRVNLRRPDPDGGDWFTDWAEEATFDLALETCMSKLSYAEFVESKSSKFVEAPKEVGKGLLAKLGLLKKEQPFERRV